MPLNLERAAAAIEDVATDLRRRAEELDRHAAMLRETGNFEIVGWAITAAINNSNMRLDVLLSRTANTMQREIDRLSEE